MARLALILQTLARLTLTRMTRTRAQLTLARLTLTRQTLIRLTLTRLTLARLTLSGLALARLTLAWLARMTRILTLTRLTLVRLTLALMTRILTLARLTLARLTVTRLTLAWVTLARMTRILTLARLTLVRLTLARQTLTRLILPRLTRARFIINPLTFYWLTSSLTAKTVLQTQPVAQNAEAASFSAASFFRTSATTAIFVNIDCATAAYFAAGTHHGCSVPPVDVIYNILIASAATADHGASTITTTASIAAVNNASAAGPEFDVATDSRAFAVIVCFAVAASIAIVAASAHTDVISTIIAGTASAPINDGDRAISAAQITLKAKASTIFPRPEEEQSTAALIPLNCNYAVELTEHVRRQFQAIPSTSATLTADGSVTAVLNFKVIQVTFITVAVVGAYNLGCSAADNPCSAIAVHYACTAFENT